MLRALEIAWFYRIIRTSIHENAKAQEAHRSLLLGLAGFSLAGLTIVATSEGLAKYGDAIVDLILSFLLYFLSLQLQGWKEFQWQDLCADAVREAANFALILFIARLIVIIRHDAKISDGVVTSLILIGSLAVAIDIIVSMRKSWSYLTALSRKAA